MIKKLFIKNFQKHKRLEITLSPQVTTIIGRTDSGKSAIVRALGMLLFNEARGKSFVTHGEANASVGIQLEDGTKLLRTKGKRNDLKVDKNVWKAFSNTYPPEIIELLNVDKELTIQNQHDPIFWLSDSAGQVAKKLNKIVDLRIIDVTMSILRGLVKDAGVRVQVFDEELESSKQTVESYQPVAKLEQSLLEIENLLKGVETASAELSELGNGIELLKSIKPIKMPTEPQIDIEQMKALKAELSEMKKLATAWDSNVLQIEQLKQQLLIAVTALSDYDICDACGQVIEG